MERLFRLVSQFCFIFSFICGFAAPIGNPATPKMLDVGFFIPKEVWVNIRSGYLGDFVFYGPMQQKFSNNQSVDKYTQMVNSGSITLNVLERLDLYGTVGATDLNYAWRFQSLADLTKFVQAQTESSLQWSIGMRALLYSYKKFDLGIGASYAQSSPSLRYLTINGANVPLQGSSVNFEAWQASAAFSYSIDIFTPYIGANYLHVQNKIFVENVAIANQGNMHNEIENQIPVGLYLGCTLSSSKYFFLNLEARLISEEAVSVSGEFRF